MMEGLLENTDIKNYLLAGNAIFTIVYKDGSRHTFKIKRIKCDLYYVYRLFGQDNTSNYEYMAFYYADSGYLGVPNKYKNTPMEIWPRHYCIINYLLNNIDNPSEFDNKIEIYHSGHCARCGRLLTTPESIKCGLGPECRRYINGN